MGVLLPKWTMRLTIEMRNKTALLGGSFDPVHIGHVNLFHNAYKLAHFSTLIVVPAFVSNFKQDATPASFHDRVEMLKLAIEDYRDLYPSDCLDIRISQYEGEKKGVSYTSDTIKHFYESLEDNGKVNFIIGDDILPDLYRWHDFEYIKNNVRFFCFSRLGAHDDNQVEIDFIESPITVASSSSIKEGMEGMLTKRVKEYIDEHKLYRAL